VVGLVAGLGEMLGYGLRMASGWWSDRARSYWPFVLVGYAVNLLAVPLLAWAGNWEWAAALMLCERIGKAVRNPARDALLSSAAEQVGRGWGFGLHEAMDQIGAVSGPLLVAWAVARGGGYRAGFSVLWIPALAALATVAGLAWLYRNPGGLEVKRIVVAGGFGRGYWLWVAGAALVAAGTVDFPLLAWRLGQSGAAVSGRIPLLYALAMGVDAVAALALGWLYDRAGARIVVAGVAPAVLAAPLVLLGAPAAAMAGVAVWGLGMGTQESVLRAGVAELAPPGRRAAAYGTFGAAFGLGWFAGSAAVGVLLGWSAAAAAVLAAGLTAAGVPLLWMAAPRRVKGSL
jgi:MFS family permease